MKISKFKDATEVILHVAEIFPFLPLFLAESVKVELILGHSA